MNFCLIFEKAVIMQFLSLSWILSVNGKKYCIINVSFLSLFMNDKVMKNVFNILNLFSLKYSKSSLHTWSNFASSINSLLNDWESIKNIVKIHKHTSPCLCSYLHSYEKTTWKINIAQAFPSMLHFSFSKSAQNVEDEKNFNINFHALKMANTAHATPANIISAIHRSILSKN